MDDGQIVECAPAKEFFDAPRQPRSREFLQRLAH
jgi:ABC-type polar amino acid transport system ATPase subunit